MAELESNNFDDPALKALMKRVGDKHRASDELRAKAERIKRNQPRMNVALDQRRRKNRREPDYRAHRQIDTAGKNHQRHAYGGDPEEGIIRKNIYQYAAG